MQRTSHCRELVWKAIGNDDGVTFADVMFGPAFDFATAKLVRRSRLGVDRLTARYQGGRAVHDIDDICIECVDFCFARFNATARVYFVAGGFNQRYSFGECLRQLCCFRQRLLFVAGGDDPG